MKHVHVNICVLSALGIGVFDVATVLDDCEAELRRIAIPSWSLVTSKDSVCKVGRPAHNSSGFS